MADGLRFDVTQKGKPLLIASDGHSYILHKAAGNGTEYWRCQKFCTCYARVTTHNNRALFIANTKEHSHLPDCIGRECRATKEYMKRSAAVAFGANTTTNIYQASLLTASDAVKATLPTANHLKRTIQRSRNKAHVPIPLPTNRDVLQVPQEFKTNGNVISPQLFLMWDSGPSILPVQGPRLENGELLGEEFVGHRILMFTTQANLNFLQQCNSVLMDGTFKTTPQLFTQLYTIHGMRLEGEVPNQKPSKTVPLIFFLLPDKAQSTYQRSFAYLAQLLPNWAPEFALLDFERAAINAAHEQWPMVEISGCFFHFNQSIWR